MKQKWPEIQEGSASNEKWTEVNKRNRMIMLQRLISANIIADHNRLSLLIKTIPPQFTMD